MEVQYNIDEHLVGCLVALHFEPCISLEKHVYDYQSDGNLLFNFFNSKYYNIWG